MTQQPEHREPNALGALILHHTVTALLLVGALALGIWGYLTYSKGGFTYAQAPTAQSATQRYLIASQERRLTLAAQTYRTIHQSPPLTLDVLVEDGLLDASDLTYPSKQVSYTLHIEGKRLFVTSAIAQKATQKETEDIVSPLD